MHSLVLALIGAWQVAECQPVPPRGAASPLCKSCRNWA